MAESAAGSSESLLSRWPPLVLIAAVIAAGFYAFSHRPLPPFPATQIRPDQLLVTDLALDESHLIAVGEQGKILYSELPGKSWRIAKVEPQRGSTLTQVIFTGVGGALAVGHDGWILKSTDYGKTWKEVAFTAQSDPLLGVSGPFGGRYFAYGAFGLMMSSTNEGDSWEKIEAPAPEPSAPAADAESSDDFPVGPPPGPLGDRHINAMVRMTGDSLLTVGERGLMALSRDDGASWTILPEIYAGSFYGALVLPSGDWFVYGMRGNAFRSNDQGATWQKVELPETAAIFAGAVTPKEVVLAGAGNTILVSKDGGATFEQITKPGRESYAAVLALPDGKRLFAGDTGLSIK